MEGVKWGKTKGRETLSKCGNFKVVRWHEKGYWGYRVIGPGKDEAMVISTTLRGAKAGVESAFPGGDEVSDLADEIRVIREALQEGHDLMLMASERPIHLPDVLRAAAKVLRSNHVTPPATRRARAEDRGRGGISPLGASRRSQKVMDVVPTRRWRSAQGVQASARPRPPLGRPQHLVDLSPFVRYYQMLIWRHRAFRAGTTTPAPSSPVQTETTR